jgi:very-short-patch-repair endonuclease
VDSAPGEGALRTLREGAYELVKKRYNVAASRARDQLWVVHSFDPMHDLKSDDLRFQLLQHVIDPTSALYATSPDNSRLESPLEKEVAKRLNEAGFRVNRQISVGHLRIDMVVEGEEKRLAVECDGDRYHSPEGLAESTARQAILERLGWQFVRIRGSTFYRDPEAALKRVFDRLAELRITPSKDGRAAKEVEVHEDATSLQGTLVEQLEALREQPPASPALVVSPSPSPRPIRKTRRFGRPR